MQQHYSIGDAARLAGVSIRKLRNWEGRYIPLPDRIVCGERAYRRYSQAQVDLIQKIAEYLEDGFTLKAASQKAHKDLGMKGLASCK